MTSIALRAKSVCMAFMLPLAAPALADDLVAAPVERRFSIGVAGAVGWLGRHLDNYGFDPLGTWKPGPQGSLVGHVGLVSYGRVSVTLGAEVNILRVAYNINPFDDRPLPWIHYTFLGAASVGRLRYQIGWLAIDLSVRVGAGAFWILGNFEARPEAYSVAILGAGPGLSVDFGRFRFRLEPLQLTYCPRLLYRGPDVAFVVAATSFEVTYLF